MSSKRASERFFLPFAKAAIGRPWLVLFACAVLTVVATYGSSRIAVNTSTEGLFSPKVEFIRNARAYEQAFPNKGAPIVAVVDASTPERAEAVARSLAERLRGDRLFEHVDVPGSEAYFRRIGLLFLDIDQLGSLRDQLQRARPALAALATQPNLAGIAKFIELITAGVNFNVEIPPELSRFVRELGETTRLQAAGRPATFSWMSVFGLGELQERGKRQLCSHTRCPTRRRSSASHLLWTRYALGHLPCHRMKRRATSASV